MARYDQHKNRRNWNVVASIICGVFLFLESCIVPLFAAEMLTIDTFQGCRCAPLPLSIEVTVGDQWQRVTKLGFLTIRSSPQMVIWSEPRNGRGFATLFITRKAGLQRWGRGSDPTKVLYSSPQN
ncbi:MAG: hypothetical protein GY801_49585 [bacterium]|nr:hypothetical protein [bacterium]